MHVRVRLYANLRQDRPPEEDMELPSGTTIASMIELLDLQAPAVTLIFINGRHADLGSEVHEGDEIALFPPIGGGQRTK